MQQAQQQGVQTCAYWMCCENSAVSWKTRQLSNSAKKALQGWSAQISHLPIARASALVVATTSLVLGFTRTLAGHHHPAHCGLGPNSQGEKFSQADASQIIGHAALAQQPNPAPANTT